MAINKTVQAVFDKAMYLIDAQNENTGATKTSDTKEYEVRTLGILNNLLDEVFPASDNYAVGADGRRPAHRDLVDFTDEIDMDAMVVRNVLPLGLAAKLLLEENAAVADYFQQRFEEELVAAMRSRPSAVESVENAYGGIECGEFAYWT